MREMVEQILVLQEKVRLVGLVVVGPEHSGQVGVSIKDGHDVLDRGRLDDHIGVDTQQDPTRRQCRAGVSGRGRALPLGLATTRTPNAVATATLWSVE